MKKNSRNRKFGKLQKKRIWPYVCLFFIMVGLTVTLVGIFVSIFMYYMASSKLEQIRNNNANIAFNLERTYETTQDIGITIDEMKRYVELDEEICFVDSEGNIAARSGKNVPEIDNCIAIDLGETYEIYQDKGGPHVFDDDFMGSMYRLLVQSFKGISGNINVEQPSDGNAIDKADMGSGNNKGFSGQWMKADMLNIGCWIKKTIPGYDGSVYIRSVFVIQRQDVFYISAVGILAVIFLLVPMTVLFINMILGIINQKRMLMLLYKDPVTEDNNWLYYKAMSLRIINRRRNKKRAYAVINLHINKYRDYCSYYGVEAGEQIIKSVNGYLRVKIDMGEVYARHSGADFALLLKYKDENSFNVRVKTIMAELMSLKAEQKISFSTGVFIIPAVEDSDKNKYLKQDRGDIDIEQIYNFACEAAVKNKKISDGVIGVFSNEMLDEEKWERKVENTMEQALLNHEFVAFYQPKYDPVSNRLVAAEALVRWLSPTEGLISPAKFIPIFEKNGFITKLDDYMIREVSKQQAEWKIAGNKIVPVSINVSRAHFVQEDLVKEFCDIVDSYGTERKMIEFEVTESAFLDDKKMMINIVKQLREKGFAISMDDFGAGYSSLNSLKELPLDIVKIDGEFFRATDEGDMERSRIIVSSVIKLAKSMSMRVVAEGVETEELRDFLAEEGCNMIQGFYYSKPVPAEEFTRRVQADA